MNKFLLWYETMQNFSEVEETAYQNNMILI